jgi:single-strand DNA-binding protein
VETIICKLAMYLQHSKVSLPKIKINLKMSFTINGQIVAKYDTQVVSDKFRKREFAIELKDGSNYTNFAKLQLTQNKCELLDPYNVGDDVKISFDVKGSKYEKNGTTSYFTNLDAWRIEKLGAENNNALGQNTTQAPPTFNEAPPSFSPNDNFADDLPF